MLAALSGPMLLALLAQGPAGRIDVDGIAVEGPRPRAELVQALASVSIAPCVREQPSGVVPPAFVAFVAYAAGVIDAVAILDADPARAVALDFACVQRQLRALRLRDRGREPATAVVFAFTDAGAALPRPVDVARALEVTRDNLEACRSRDLAGGALIVRFTVDAEGGVRDAMDAGGPLGPPHARACMVRAVERARFDPPPGSDVVVTWRFLFAPRPAPPSGLQAPTLLSCLGITF